MPFPIISDIAAMLKGESSDAPAESIDTTTVEEVAAETTTAETIEETPASAPSAESPPVSTGTPEAPTVAGLLSTKGAAALIAELPEDLRDQLGSELNKTWYKRLNQRDTEIRRLEAAQAASAESIQSHIDKRLDEILTSGMTEDDRKAYVDRRELEKRREQDAKAQTTQKNPLDDPQVQQHLASGWAVVKEAGLPIDANDPRVKTVWAEGWNHPDPEGGLSAMRAAAKRVTTPTTSAPAAPSVDIDKLVSERLEAAMDKKLRAMGILKSDSGKPGSASPTKPNSSWDTARLESEQAFRDAGRG
jgi:hypothetical protein